MYLKIKKGEMEVSVPKNYVANVAESGDGIVFMLQNGVRISCEDYNMPPMVKSTIKMAVDAQATNETTVLVDLLNYSKPVSIEV